MNTFIVYFSDKVSGNGVQFKADYLRVNDHGDLMAFVVEEHFLVRRHRLMRAFQSGSWLHAKDSEAAKVENFQ